MFQPTKLMRIGRSVTIGLLLCGWLTQVGTAAAGQISLDEYLAERYPDEPDRVSAMLDDINRSDEPLVTPNPYAVRVGLGHSAGQNVGVPGSFTTLESFVPLFEEPGSSLLFFEARGHLDNYGNPAANVGFGRRFVWDAMPSAVIGWSAFYDYRRTTHELDFHQLGLGIEFLTDQFEIRSNAYLPNVGKHRRSLDNRFVGNSLNLDRAEVAVSGADFEVGVVLPPLGQVQAKVFGGGYFLGDSDVANVTGWRARTELAATEMVTAGVSVQDDKVFGSTVMASVTLRSLLALSSQVGALRYPPIDSFRRGDGSHLTRSAKDRLADPVQRLPFIVTGIDDGDAAINPATGLPYLFLHAVPGAANGNGSIERPYASLSAAMNDARSSGAVVYTPQGGTFIEDVVITAGSTATGTTFLLSNAERQVIPITRGELFVPLSGIGQSSPNAARIIGDVTVGSRTEVDGFRINGGVSGNSVVRTTIERNIISNPGGVGIMLDSLSNSASTPLLIQNNTITESLSGIYLSGFNPPNAADPVHIYATVAGNKATGVASGGQVPEVGIAIEATASRVGSLGDEFVGKFRGNITDNTVSGYRKGIRVLAAKIENTTPDDWSNITGNTASDNLIGIQLGDLGLGSDICATLTGNIANTTTMQGLLIQGNSFTGTIGQTGSGNTFNNSSLGQGVFVDLRQRPNLPSGQTGGKFIGDIIGNTTSQNASDGLLLSAISFAGNVTQNTANQNGRTANPIGGSGIVLDVPLVNAQTPTATISNNTANRNGLDGMRIIGPGIGAGGSVRSVVHGLIQSNTTNNNLEHGLLIAAYDDLTATLGSSDTSTTGGNIATNNVGRGIFIDNIDRISGTLSGNMATRNQDSGIVVSNFNQLLGTLSNNTASENSNFGIALSGVSWGGFAPIADPAQVLLQANTTNLNGTAGLLVETGVINGTLIDNIAQQNGREGVRLNLGRTATLTGSSSIFLTQTMLAENNLSELAAFPKREFVLQNFGADLVNITFNGNTSENVVSGEPSDRQFNFDLLNADTSGGIVTGPGFVNPMSLLNNTGTAKRIFGSSDDSVTVLFAN